ncbi:hypothetical protein N7U49_48115 (plasmid) [Streptomyces sp. AD2-2]|nr:hypothetical protein N7U49_48115 [Streptomyces sp. AD2-2]
MLADDLLPTDRLVDDAVIPCTSQDPRVVHAVVTECRPGDLLRVTGHLTLPDAAGQGIRFQADTLEVLFEAPELGGPEDDEPTDAALEQADRNTAIAALAEALTGFAGQPGPGASIRIHISPNGALGTGLEHCHSIDITPARAHRLADHADAMSCFPDSQNPDTGTVLDPETIAELSAVFETLDLVDLTGAVLKATRPEHRPKVTQAIDDMFGDAPGPEEPE